MRRKQRGVWMEVGGVGVTTQPWKGAKRLTLSWALDPGIWVAEAGG